MVMHARNLHRSCNLMQQSDHQAIVYVHQCHEINEMPVGGFQRPMPSMDKETDIEFRQVVCNESSALKPTTAGCLLLLCSLHLARQHKTDGKSFKTSK